MRPPRMLVPACALAGAVLAACGASSGSSSAQAGAPAAGAVVRVADFAFSPSTVTVHAGDTVTWQFHQPDAPHNVAVGSGPDQFTSGAPQGRGQFHHQFTQAGTYRYVCVVHPGMQGTVVVAP